MQANNLSPYIELKGNQTAEEVKNAFKKSHFLVFISKTEGWPKVVAESMFWGCYPITTPVSMVPEMIKNGERGSLVSANPKEIGDLILHLISNPERYYKSCQEAMNWSRQFTLNRFEKEIEAFL